MRYRFPYLWLLALLLAAALAPAPALACTEPAGGLPTITPAERATQAELLVHGEVVVVRDGPGGTPGEIADIRVISYIKGQGPASLTVTGFGPGSICRAEVSQGEVGIFSLMRDAEGGWRAFYLSQFDAALPASPELIAELTAAVGQEPFVPPAEPQASTPGGPEPAGATAAPAQPEGGMAPLFINIGVVILAGLGLMAILVLRRRRGGGR